MLAPYVRVFGDKIVPEQPKQATVDRIIAGLRELGEYAKGSDVAVILESHGDFTDSPTLLEIMKGAEMPTVGLLWDAHHTAVAGRENPAHTFREIGRYVRHTHLKDSKPEGDGVRYVLTGKGTVPVRETVRLLAAGGYPGSYAKGNPITGLVEAQCLPNTKIFHAGTAKEGERVVTNGGRVLGVTAWAKDLAGARAAAYAAVEKIHFEGAHYRRDIAAGALL